MSPSRRRWFKGVAALLSVVFGMGILSFACGWQGVGYPTTFFVKTRHEGEDYWMENPGFLYRFVPKAQARSPRPVMVPVAKQDHTIRIFVLGESAAMGDPEPAFGMPEILRVLLESRYPQTRFEVVNTALTAINSHLIHHIAAECVQKEADFLVLYMGNNEVTGPMGPGTVFGDTRSDSWMLQLGLQLKNIIWVRRWMRCEKNYPEIWVENLPRVGGGIAMFEGRHVPMDDPRLIRVHASFEHHLETILNSAQKQGILIVMSSLACNLKDSAPFASSSLNHLEESWRQSWQDAYDQGIALLGGKLGCGRLGCLSNSRIHRRQPCRPPIFSLGPVYWHWVRLRRLSPISSMHVIWTFSDSGPAMSSMTSSSDLSMKISLRVFTFRPGEINGGNERGRAPRGCFFLGSCTSSSRVTIFWLEVLQNRLQQVLMKAADFPP